MSSSDPFQVPSTPAGHPPSGQAPGYQPPGYQPPEYQPPGYLPPGYQPPGFGPPYGAPATPGTNGLAIASLVLGIVWLYGLGSLLAVIFGHVARKQIKQSGQGGKGLATAGLVLGYIGLALLVIVLIGVASNGSSGS